jgi:hypothetical protein
MTILFKKISLIVIAVIHSICAFAQYNSSFVETESVLYKSVSYDVITMLRSKSSPSVHVKYFGAKGQDGKSVSQRYTQWKSGRNIICFSSAGYMDYSKIPVGLCVDNGVIVNSTLEKWDALVIVYATGGMVVSNLKNADLTVQGGNIPSGTKLDIKNNALHRKMFLDWAVSERATVFQTHLFVYKNTLDAGINNTTARERRFLAVGTLESSNDIAHVIVNSKDFVTLNEGAKRTFDFLTNKKHMNVIFMINLDTGMQDVFQLYDADGNKDSFIVGPSPLTDAANLLIYYYEP